MFRVLSAAAVAVMLSVTVSASAQGTAADPLSRGIALYQDRSRNEEALAVLRRAMDSPETRTLARYYSARLRCRYGQFSTARTLLLAARADSAGFDDAAGMLAWTNLKLGNTTEALREWRRFVAAVGRVAPDETISTRSIMLPDEYRNRLAELHPVQAPVPADSAARDSSVVKPAPAQGVGRPDATAPGTDSAAGELDRRIQSQIRTGYYVLVLAAVVIGIGMLLAARWARKRRRIAGPEFLAEVGRMLDLEGDEFAMGDEELAERELRRAVPVRREPSPAPPEPPEPRAPVRPPVDAVSIPVAAAVFPEPEYPPPAPPEEPPFFAEPPESGASRRPVTEEVKALVTRLHREGHAVLDIARLADLTRSEVELIVAVRARTTGRLVETAAEPEPESRAGTFHRAVAALAAEGYGDIEIARRLRVSTSEVALARAVIARLRNGGR